MTTPTPPPIPSLAPPPTPASTSTTPPPSEFTIPNPADALRLDCDVLVIGGGTAGTMAALTAAQHGASVLVLEKAHVRHSGALAMGMDGVNNAVIPGKADPDDYVADVTRANDGIVNQRTIRQTATRGFDMVRRLERYGVKFEKDERGEYAVRRVHRSGSYVLPMPEGKDVKKVLYRVLRERSVREKVRIENRVMPVRVLTRDGRAVGAVGFNTRTGEFVTVTAGAVILATGPAGRLGLPASGYLYGTYENPTNAGDGYSMAYHAGAELSGIECFQINPLIKDYNGPACAYVANPFGGYQVNANGDRFVDCDYWSGEMMAEVAREVNSARGPIYLRTTHLAEETIRSLEGILHTTERPTRGTFHGNRGHDYRTHDVEMHISEIGLCGGHSASGVWVDENANTTVPGLYAAGDLACVPHNYMIGAFVFGDLAGAHAADRVRTEAHARTHAALPADQLANAHELIYRPLRNPDGPPQQQVEYKLRRFVNDYVAPPKTGRKLAIALDTFERMSGEVAQMGARTPHELMRCAEVTFILDCATMAAASSLVRTESRWGLYHDRADLPQRDDDGWMHHLNLRRDTDGRMEFIKRPVAPYEVPVAGFEPSAQAQPEYLGALTEGLDVARAGTTPQAPSTPTPTPTLIPTTSTSALSPASALTAASSTSPTPTTSGPTSATPDALTTPNVPASTTSTATATARILNVLALTEREFDADLLAPHLTDPSPDVRRAVVSVVTELAPPQAGPILANLLADDAPEVRAAAAAALVELAEVLAPTDELADALTAAGTSTDPLVRATALDVLRALGLGTVHHFADSAMSDPSPQVRAAAIRALASHDETEPIAARYDDADLEVRLAVAQTLGVIARPDASTISALASLAADAEPRARAAALDATAKIAATTPTLSTARVAATAPTATSSTAASSAATPTAGALDATAKAAAATPTFSAATSPNAPSSTAALSTVTPTSGAPTAASAPDLSDQHASLQSLWSLWPLASSGAQDIAWQVRKAAASALGALGILDAAAPESEQAVRTLTLLARDSNADVRRSAVIALTPYAATNAPAAAALTRAADDTDADVRAYARQAIRDATSETTRDFASDVASDSAHDATTAIVG